MVNIQYIRCEGDSFMINMERFSIKGFKNIKDIDLKLNKITSLIALNNFGKSNIIKSLDFGIDFITQNEKTRKSMMTWETGLPFNKNIKEKKYEFEIEFVTKIEQKFQKIIYGYSFNWTTDKKKSGKIMNEYLKVKIINETQKFTNYIKREQKQSYYKSSITGNCDKEIKISDSELVINKLLAYDDLFYSDLVTIINNIKIYIERHFDSSDNYDLSPLVMKDDTTLGLLKEDNVPKILAYIKDEYPDNYELIVNTFKDLFPFIEEIEVNSFVIDAEKIFNGKINEKSPFKISNTLYYLFVKDKNLTNVIPFELMSDGAKRVLLIFTYLTLAEINNCSLVIIEEPENSVHPRLLQQYLIALDGFLQNSKLLITSHSPYLINYLDPSNLYLGIPNDNGLANFYKVKNSSTKKIMSEANELDILTGDYLFDLMSGTEEDIELLSSYVEM